MMAAFLSAFLLGFSSVDAILEHGLDSPEGRTMFLTESLRPYVERADQLNQEIMALSEEVTQKMALLNEMLPTVNMAMRIDSDFQQIDTILQAQMLTAEQEEIADRITAICRSIDAAMEN